MQWGTNFSALVETFQTVWGGIRVTKEGDAILAPPSFVVPVGHDPTTP